MERHPLDHLIPLDLWREIKTYIVHNIRTQAKHTKKDKSIINFNRCLQHLPTFLPVTLGPQIIFNSAKKKVRIATYLYHVQAFKPVDNAAEPYRDGKISVIVYSLLKFKNGFPARTLNCENRDVLYHRLDYRNYWAKHETEHGVMDTDIQQPTRTIIACQLLSQQR